MSIADIVIYIALLPQLDETSVGAMVPLIGMCHEKCLCAASPNVFWLARKSVVNSLVD